MAAVELLNVIRPIVAVSVYLTFAALALHQYPECRTPLLSPDPRSRTWFALEVRRFYPFFPSLVARVRENFTWNSFHFKKGARALLDMYGINHDPAVWQDPMAFRPERFREQTITPFNFLPQGGGDVASGHRCPGEEIAMALIERTAELLASKISWTVPEQDLTIDYTRLPVLPVSHFQVSQIQTADA